MLSFTIVVLSKFFIAVKELDKNEYGILSDNGKNTRKLVKKLNSNQKCMPIDPGQVFSTNGTAPSCKWSP